MIQTTSKNGHAAAADEKVSSDEKPKPVFPVVGVGGSAGGLEAFVELLSAMPADTGMAFVMILHLPPDRDSLLVEILGKHTSMPVLAATEGLKVQPNHVYAIRPGFTLTLQRGILHLGEPLEKRGHRCPVNDFFASLAADRGVAAACIVMSGMGANGTAGARAVKAAGGLCIAQDPASAKFTPMPRHLIDSGLADMILAPRQMPKALIDYASHPYVRSGDREATSTEAQALNEILTFLRARSRQDFFGYKRPTILRRVQRRMSMHRLQTMPEYVALLGQNPGESAALADDLRIHVTGFFRDPEVWTALREKVLVPQLSPRGADPSFRAWVPACATGEEAYTLAMLLVEAAHGSDRHIDIRIFATDTAERVLAVARTGVYPSEIESEVSPERLARFFDKEDGAYRVKKELRELIVFAPQDILQDPPFSRLDLCTCRNLLIYLESDVQRRALSLIHFGLREGGTLVLGTSETVSEQEGLYEGLDPKHRIYRRIGPTRYGSVDFSARPFTPVTATGDIGKPQPGAGVPSVSHLTQKALLDRFGPPSVVIDRHQHVIYYHGRTEHFLTLPAGEPTRDLMALVREPYQGAVRAALQQAFARNETASVRDGVIETFEGRRRLEIVVSPFESGALANCFMVSFAASADTVPSAEPQTATSEDGALMREELIRVRSELRTTLDELQAGNEEMKAANEEATSINEELQSTNEELETSKEELQSLNEELTTVNGQLQAKMEELEATTNDLSSLLSSTDIAVVFLDTQFRIRRFTPAIKDLLDLIQTDAGRPLADMACKFRDTELLSDAKLVLEKLVPVEKEVTSESKRVYLRRILPYRTGDNRIDGVVITFVDITRRKLAETKVDENEERQRLILAGIREYAIFMLDPDGSIMTWNSAAQQLLGYSVNDVLGRSLAILGDSDLSAEEEIHDKLAAARRAGSVSTDGWRVAKSGRRFWASGTISALTDHDGRLIGYVKVLRDNTERKVTEEALQRAVRSAEDANAAKDRFLANVSHELRTPLSAISLWSALFEDGRPVEAKELKEALDIIRGSAEDLRSLIEDLVDSSRITSGRLRLELEPVRLDVIAREMAERASVEADLKKLTVVTEADPALGVARADAHRLKQIVSNLVRNAMKFTPTGGNVQVRWKRAGDEVTIEVSDDGIGMPPEFLSKLFERFVQAEPSPSRIHGGLGLGLAIASELVRLHSGTIRAESPGLGKGSVFTVVLPLPAVQDWPGEEPARPLKPDALKGLRILIVEDTAVTSTALRMALTNQGAAVTEAASVAEALRALELARPDVMVSDLGMPHADGYSLIKTVRAGEKTRSLPRLPAIALTAFAGTSDMSRALECGFDRCLTKPITPKNLILEVARMAGRNAG